MNFVELPIEKLDTPTKTIDQQKLDLDINDFLNNDIIIIKSGTATGKTRNIAKIAKELKDKEKVNLLSIVNLISLSREQISTFKDVSKIILADYQTGVSDFGIYDGVICLNSLDKLKIVKDFDPKKTVLYIDEVNDLLYTLTESDNLDSKLNIIYSYLMYLVKSCYKVILSDATINLNVLNLIGARKTNNKSILINNTNKKFSNINANRFNNENEFLDNLKEHINNDKYFLFGCDSCTKITTFYTNLIGEFKDKKDKFVLITSETQVKVKNASKEFENKFVFYSPSITTGVSFVLEDVKQAQFIYITGKSVNPVSIYQMSCRTRNMEELNLFCNDIPSKPLKYNSFQDAKNHYKQLINMNEKILSLSKTTTEDDDIKVVENTFFKIFCYNKFIDGIYFTDFLTHYENILKNNGFVMNEIGEHQILNSAVKGEYKLVYDVIKEEEFEQFAETYYKQNVEDKETIDKIVELENHTLCKRAGILGIQTAEDAYKYKSYIRDDFKLKSYYSAINLLKTDEYIKSKMDQKRKDTFIIKSLGSIFNKVSLLRQFELFYKIERFNLDFSNVEPKTEISKDFQKVVCNVFRSKKDSYTTKEDLLKVYVNMINNICGDLDLIKSGQKQVNKVRTRVYTVNQSLLVEIISLMKIKHPLLKNCNIKLIEDLTGIKPDERKEIQNCFMNKDDDDEYAEYLYNKTIKR